MHNTSVIDGLYERMEKIREEVPKGKNAGSRELKLFDKGVEKIKLNHRAGKHVREREHIKPYRYYEKILGKRPVALWRLGVHPKWRMIYFTASKSKCPEEAKNKPTHCVIIDFLTHNEYNKIFGY